MKILSVHAHFDDYEFTAAGTFEMWKRKLGGQLRAKVIVCTDGKAGHQFRTRDETGKIRLQEQLASAEIGGYEFEQLRYPSGEVPREACLQVSTDLLAALWKSVRDFEPDYVFCPPLPAESLAGIHVDHVAVAEAMRKVAYMINVPHAFTPEFPADETKSKPCKVPVILNVYDGYMSGANSFDFRSKVAYMINVPHAFTPEFPADETKSKPCKVPVILNVYDGYMSGANSFDFVVDVEDAFPDICRMSWCHQSQIAEWLPWVGRHSMEPPKSPKNWST